MNDKEAVVRELGDHVALLEKKVELMNQQFQILEQNLFRINENVDVKLNGFMAALGGLLIETSKNRSTKQQSLLFEAITDNRSFNAYSVFLFRIDDECYVHPVNDTSLSVRLELHNGNIVSPPADVIVTELQEHLGERLPFFKLQSPVKEMAHSLLNQKEMSVIVANVKQG